MKFKNWFRPFEVVGYSQRLLIVLIWVAIVTGYWIFSSSGSKHLFPTPSQLFDGFQSLYREGLVVHIFSSLALFGQAVGLSIIFSLIVVYLSPLPALRPIGELLSKLRYYQLQRRS